jgi:hypothetical protein
VTYAEIRQRVLAQLSPEMSRAEPPALPHTPAYIALHRDAQEAAVMLTGGPDVTSCLCPSTGERCGNGCASGRK